MSSDAISDGVLESDGFIQPIGSAWSAISANLSLALARASLTSPSVALPMGI